jgi:O-antigen ligase
MITDKKYEIIDRIIEYGVYLYIFLMFLAKGEGIRNVLIFGNFTLWLLTVRYRAPLFLLKDPVMILVWIYLASIISSVVFSIDPAFSLVEFKGDPLKFGLLLPVIATVMADEKRLVKACCISFVTLMFIVLAGYYSYAVYDIPMLKPHTVLVHAWHSKFARYLCILMPYSFILYFAWKRRVFKKVLIASLIVSAVALLLSTARAGLVAFMSIAAVWILFLTKGTVYNFWKITGVFVILLLLTGSAIFFFIPDSDIRDRISRTSKEISTLNLRTDIWKSAMYAFMERPVVGWGYGARIFHQDEPFRDTPYKKAPQTEKGPHNMFINVLFHQGLVGIVPHVLLILTSIVLFWSEAVKPGESEIICLWHVSQF